MTSLKQLVSKQPWQNEKCLTLMYILNTIWGVQSQNLTIHDLYENNVNMSATQNSEKPKLGFTITQLKFVIDLQYLPTDMFLFIYLFVCLFVLGVGVGGVGVWE